MIYLLAECRKYFARGVERLFDILFRVSAGDKTGLKGGWR